MNIKSLGIAALAAVAVSAAPDPNFHIYLAFGQSNMEGQGNIEQQDKTVDSRFQMMSTVDNAYCTNRTKGNWYTATPPLASCDGKLGPVDYFGRTMLESLPKEIKVGVVVVAVAGCDIQLFEKDKYQSYVSSAQSWMSGRINNYGGNPYGRLVEMGKKAQEAGVIKGILLHQGETNSGQQNWPSRVKGVYDNLIKDLNLNASEVPLLAGEVHPSGSSNGMNSIIAKLPQQASNFYVVSAQGVTGMLQDGQNVHWNSDGYRKLGARYAETMLKALGPVTVVSESSSSVASSSSVSPVSSSSVMPPYSSSAVLPPVQSSSSENPSAIASVNATNAVGLAYVEGGRLYVPVMQSGEIVSAKVYSMLGKEILDFCGSVVKGRVGFDLSSVSAGRYMLSVTVGSARTVQQVQIK